jgi:hypothetical protein
LHEFNPSIRSHALARSRQLILFSLGTKMNIFASTQDDLQQGWVWLKKENLPARSVVKITNAGNGKSVYCESLQIDSNFLSNYNQSPRFSITDPQNSIVLNGWFRAKLGVQTQTDVPITIQAANGHLGRFLACTGHPQVIVRVAAWLGLISVSLGVLGAILGVVSLLR